MQIERATPEVLRALDDVEAAHRLLLGASQVEWESGAADRFRGALAEAQVLVREVRAAIGLTLRPVAAADADPRAAVALVGSGGR